MKVREIIEKLNGDYTITTLGKEIQISEKKLRGALKELGAEFDNSLNRWSIPENEDILEQDINSFVTKKTQKTNQTTFKNEKVQMGTQVFTDDEIEVLKRVVEERKSTKEYPNKYKIYEELSKVPTSEETVRSAFNISKSTIAQLKRYAEERRLPLQDLVELAIINMLSKYDK